jgi:predicted Zn-dependent protease
MAVVVWITFPVGFVWLGLPKISVAISQSIPIAWEKSLGKYVLKEISHLIAPDVSREPLERQKLLQQRFSELVLLAKLPEARLLMRSGPVNALALPGNTVVLMDGLVSKLSDDQVMAVVAHELGHLHHRHVMQRIVSMSMLGGVVETLAGGNSQASKVGALASGALINSAYSRSQEAEADAYAIALLKADGESGVAFAEAMEFFDQYEKQQNMLSGGWLSSHPSTPQRIEKAKAATSGPTKFMKCRFDAQQKPELVCK